MTHRSCRVCRCTDERACPAGCAWVTEDLCSLCVGYQACVTLRVAGEPVAQPRIKVRVIAAAGRKPFASIYTPGGATAWKQLIILAARTAPGMPREPWDGPVRLDAFVYRPRPQALLRRSAPDGVIPCAVKPDRDNVEKPILDALTKAGLWLDDSRVFRGEVAKFYAARGAQPGAVIQARLVEDRALPGVVP